MRTYTLKTFYFSELSQKAQQRAYENDRDSVNADFYNDDFRTTLEAFEEIFNISVYRWEVSSNHYNFDFHQKDGDHADEINNPLRLATFVWNNFAARIKKGKYYSTNVRLENGRYINKHRYSKIFFEMDNCPLTGCFCDSDILTPVIDCLTYSKFYDTFDDLMTDCLNRFFKTWSDCLEYSESFDFYEGEAEANDWEYFEDGTKFVNQRLVKECL